MGESDTHDEQLTTPEQMTRQTTAERPFILTNIAEPAKLTSPKSTSSDPHLTASFQQQPRNAKTRRVTIMSVIALICVGLALSPVLAHVVAQRHAGAKPTATPPTLTVTNDSTQWLHVSRTTAASFPFTAPTNPTPQIDPAFQAYYSAHAGASSLGAPLTAAFPVQQGIVQFFLSGALLLPSDPHGASTASTTSSSAQAVPGAISSKSVQDGQTDSATGIVRLSLLDALLTAGSEAPIAVNDGDESTLTYVDLRRAALPNAMVSAPATPTPASTPTPTGAVVGTATPSASTTPSATAQNQNESTQQSAFIPEGRLSGSVIGHTIPAALWSYLTLPANAPDGWQADFGLPLTEALPLTVTHNGVQSHMLAQAFSLGVLLVDEDHDDASGQPIIQRVQTGLVYLHTSGTPTPTLSAQQHLWALNDTALLTAPATGSTQIHVGQNFPLTSSGEAQWVGSNLWYAVSWTSQGGNSGTGWIAATHTTPTPPMAGALVWQGFDALSSDLGAYLASQGSNTGAVVYDMTRGRYYTYNENGQFIMASSVKVPIMLTLLTQLESQGREPNDNEMYLLTTMIENSDNDSAQALFDEIGGAPALASFMQKAGVSGMNPDPDAWGYTTISPLAMVQLLTLLQQGKVLTAQDRSLALNLMENIESDEQNGVGNTAPAGATVAMKDGWVPTTDGLWAMNTSGIVTVGQEVYIVSVYTQRDQQLGDGWTIVQHVCGAVGKLLTA